MFANVVLLIFFVVIFNNYGLFAQKINFEKYRDVMPTKTNVRIASISVIPDKWEKEKNWNRIAKKVREAVIEGGAELVVTPEGALEGYVINEVNEKWKLKKDKDILDEFMNLGEPIDGPFIRKASALSKELKIYFILGFLEREIDILYNSAIIIDPKGEIIGRYRKTHFAQGYTINPEFYKSGEDYPVFNTTFGKIGIMICYDRQLPEPARILTLNGAEILIVPSYGGYSDEHGWNTILMRIRARENGVPLVFCHPFQSLLIDDDGEISEIGQSNSVAFYDVKVAKGKNKVLRNRRPETYQLISDQIIK